jgi:hypothetical protein
MSKQTAENGYIAAALREHRMVHDPATGAARCECGWTGPYTRLPGSDMAFPPEGGRTVIDYFHDGDGTYQVTTATGHVYLLQVINDLVLWDYTVISTLAAFPPALPADLDTARYVKVG